MSLRQHAATFRDIGEQIEALEETRDEHAWPIERAAHAILQARRYYRRSGSRPSLREVNEDGAYFNISNGYDTDDDMGATLSWAELEDIDATIERDARAREERERQAAAQELERAQERARRAGLTTEPS